MAESTRAETSFCQPTKKVIREYKHQNSFTYKLPTIEILAGDQTEQERSNNLSNNPTLVIEAKLFSGFYSHTKAKAIQTRDINKLVS